LAGENKGTKTKQWMRNEKIGRWSGDWSLTLMSLGHTLASELVGVQFGASGMEIWSRWRVDWKLVGMQTGKGGLAFLQIDATGGLTGNWRRLAKGLEGDADWRVRIKGDWR